MVELNREQLNLAGEYRVCSEMIKRGIFATITYGNHKAADIYAINRLKNKSAVIEVKTSKDGKFITGFFQKFGTNSAISPDFWVLFLLKSLGNDKFEERFFVLTNEEMENVQKERNKPYMERYINTHGISPDIKRGVDNVLIRHVEIYENQWSKIIHYIK